MLKKLALIAIRFYQKRLSPLKGFSCAYRVHTGSASCSAFGHQAIEKHGVLKGLFLLRKRFDKCAHIHHANPPAKVARPSAPHANNPFLRHQAGYADCSGADCSGCDAPGHCDVPAADLMPGCCEVSPFHTPDACDAADCGCDILSNANSCSSTGSRSDCCFSSGNGVTREQTRQDERKKRREEPANEVPDKWELE